jgi:ribosomal protein S12 methylthiotransferase accessory factor
MLAAALQTLRPLLPTLGITRLGDLTGLDRLGIPVVQATRPAALSNIVNQGKASTLAGAAVSAVLEAAETFFAERLARFQTLTASAEALHVPAGWFEHQLCADAPRDWRNAATAWLEAADPVRGTPCHVPFELVHTAFAEAAPETDGLFAGSTTGLACAFEQEGAVLHAVLECLERDAIARAMTTHGFFQRARVDPRTVADPVLRTLLATIEGAGLLVGLWHAEAVAGIPVFWCHLMEADGTAAMTLPLPADGSAAGLDPADAARRAIEEAAQSRLTAISGARDDFGEELYPQRPDWRALDAHRGLLAEGPQPCDFRRICDRAPAFEGPDLLAAVTDRTPLALVRLDTTPLTSLAAVRVLAPCLLPLPA